MRITVESTDRIVTLNGIPARIWEGETDSGIKLHCFITRIGINKNEHRLEEFEQELQETKSPSPEMKVYPTSLIL